jgi:predicted nucleotidyltransferase
MMQNKLRTILARLKSISQVKAIYLYGSYARNEQRQTSDMDICIITDKNISASQKSKILSNTNKETDLTLIWDLPSSIAVRVFREGKLLYERPDSELFLQRAKKETLKNYLDLKPMLERYTKRILGVV